MDEEVEKLITISTDKAVNPINVMGATKLLAERLTVSANYYKGERETVFSCVRFGNVLDSRGSAVPLFREQIEKGGPVTVTNPDMTRFVMSIPKAVDLVLKATELAQGGEIFILKMPVLRIGDLARAMIDELAPRYGYHPQSIKVEIVARERLRKSMRNCSPIGKSLQNEAAQWESSKRPLMRYLICQDDNKKKSLNSCRLSFFNTRLRRISKEPPKN